MRVSRLRTAPRSGPSGSWNGRRSTACSTTRRGSRSPWHSGSGCPTTRSAGIACRRNGEPTFAWRTTINFYPGAGGDFWIRRVHPFYWAKRGYDEVQRGSEGHLMTGIRFNFTRQGFLNVSHARGHEPWRGQRFESARSLNLFGDVQILRWLEVSGSFNMGPEIYYDPIEPFQGESQGGHVGISLQPDAHLSVDLDATRVRFDRRATGERVFAVDVVNLRATYQFNKHFLVRVLEQFDSSTHRLLTDALASYELVPGTVLHAGYGSLYERRADSFGAMVSADLGEKYLTVNRGVFFKASYLHRF